MLIISGCAADTAGTEDNGRFEIANEYLPSFDAKIIEINGTHVIVQTDDEEMLRSADEYSFSCSELDDIGAKVGDYIHLCYTGDIRETYPAQIDVTFWQLITDEEEAGGTDETTTRFVDGDSENGDSDEDTSVTEFVCIDMPRMIKVDGVLYYSTEEESTVTLRCGMMDGSIDSTVAATETPTEDNQSNFGTGYGYQKWDVGVIEVYINDEWIVFKADPNDIADTTNEDATRTVCTIPPEDEADADSAN